MDQLQLAAQYKPGSEAKKALITKIDTRIIPTIWALYTLSYLDSANVGNAKTGGLEADLNLTSTQYSIFHPTLMISGLRPSLYLSGLCIIRGDIAVCMAAAKTYQALAGTSFVLGFIEAGFAPGVEFYLSFRFSLYYTATAISGAFSGLLAGTIRFDWLTTAFLGWTGYLGRYRTIPLYVCALVCIIGFCWGADYYKAKPLFNIGAGALGTIFFIIVTCVTAHMVQYVSLILAFGCVCALPPLVLTWVANVLSHPIEKRGVAIAVVNALGCSASIYGVSLWPSQDAPRYIPGFAATTCFMALLVIITPIMWYLVNRYPYSGARCRQSCQGRD
ncbi:MFS transporter [Cryptococcus deuterogattii 99/473]|uniref:Unplaced genomic scaffold supercont1.1, whole genome shotgun sequence n=1 Tax=Cryptococcus deuterogattii Ram5 TaxID=1296110 RepID=A0A0D0VFR8_9TREE|nr:MFS transporter [Cryptococcus deuterogattii Ram5]KIY60478.1 MFS transporter [Cryptococcus deuterogattii 99/473]